MQNKVNTPVRPRFKVLKHFYSYNAVCGYVQTYLMRYHGYTRMWHNEYGLIAYKDYPGNGRVMVRRDSRLNLICQFIRESDKHVFTDTAVVRKTKHTGKYVPQWDRILNAHHLYNVEVNYAI